MKFEIEKGQVWVAKHSIKSADPNVTNVRNCTVVKVVKNKVYASWDGAEARYTGYTPDDFYKLLTRAGWELDETSTAKRIIASYE